MRLTELEISGLKRHDRTLRPGPVTVLRGPMGSGKTEAIQALQLLVRGEIPARGAQKGMASGDKIIALARGDHMRVRGVWSGPNAWVEREWRRVTKRVKGEEKVTIQETVSSSFAEGSKSTVEALIKERLGGWSEAWAPDDLIDLPRDQLRRRLVSIVATEDLSIERFKPADCPAWAKPLTGQSVVDWVSAAAAKAKERAAAVADEVKKLDAQLEALPFVPEGEADSSALEASLRGLRDELVRGSKRTGLETEIAKLRAEVGSLKSRVMPALSMADAHAAVNAAAEGAARFKPIDQALAQVESRLAGMRQAIADSAAAGGEDEVSAQLDEARRSAAEAQGILAAARTTADRARADRERRVATVKHEIAKATLDLNLISPGLRDRPLAVYGAEAHAQVVAQEAAARATYEKAFAEWRAAQARAEEAGQGSPIAHCPFCEADLAAFMAQRAKAAARKLEDALLLRDSANAAYQEAVTALEAHKALKMLAEDRERAKGLSARLDDLEAQKSAIEAEPVEDIAALEKTASEAAKRVTELERAHRAASARRQAAELEAEHARLTAELEGREAADEAIVEAATALDLARAQEAIRKDISSKEIRLERLSAELDELAPARPATEAQAEIAKAEAALKEVGGASERRTQRQQAEEALVAKVDELAAEKAWVATFAKLEAQILGTVAERLTGPATKVLGSPVGIELVNHRGGPDCRITIAGVDTATISKGERMTFLGGLLMSLAPSARGWRLLLMDELEAISLEREGGGVGPRETFLRSMVDAVREGLFDQVIVGGCPDVLPAVEGLTVIDFGAEAGRVDSDARLPAA